jgi:hypothetical protein
MGADYCTTEAVCEPKNDDFSKFIRFDFKQALYNRFSPPPGRGRGLRTKKRGWIRRAGCGILPGTRGRPAM